MEFVKKRRKVTCDQIYSNPFAAQCWLLQRQMTLNYAVEIQNFNRNVSSAETFVMMLYSVNTISSISGLP